MFVLSVVILSQTRKSFRPSYVTFRSPYVRKMMLTSRSPKRSTFSIGLAGGPGIVNWI